ncbi:hypothetical protein L484_010054 [Morus notabilis]|uniref:Uncharacterized protein n=1 Tax=Morus notabilis TaxID=981085 RepID=W9RES2_9ROSA|nr:hypothetical protein L484_010054 [Morus notabilis]
MENPLTKSKISKCPLEVQVVPSSSHRAIYPHDDPTYIPPPSIKWVWDKLYAFSSSFISSEGGYNPILLIQTNRSKRYHLLLQKVLMLGKLDTFAFMLPSLVGEKAGKLNERAKNIASKMREMKDGQILLTPWNVG